MELRDFLTERDRRDLERTVAGKAEPAGIAFDGITATVVGNPDELNIPALLRAHQLDPDEWDVVSATVNRWGAESKTHGAILHSQLRINLKRRVSYPLLLPAPQPRAWTPPADSPKPADAPRLILVTTDSQIPFHDEALHQISCQFAHDMQIDEWVDLGDFLDLPNLSKFRQKPEWHATVQESVNTGARVKYERTTAAPAWCRKRETIGNHDRMRGFLLDHAPQLFGLKRAEIGPPEHESVLDLNYLMRSKELGWDVARSEYGEYPYSSLEIAPGLIGIHGSYTGNKGGVAIHKELERRDHGTIQGHTNKLSLVAYTRLRANGDPFTTFGCEAGMMGRVDGGMGFAAPGVNWTQGFVTVTVQPSGRWQIELAPFIGGELRWRDRAWTWKKPRAKRKAA